MSTWKGKALELLPSLKVRLLRARDLQTFWEDVQREFYSAKDRGDDAAVSCCLRYAAWTLHPTPQAKTIAEVSEAAARLIYAHADDLHRWINRYDFITAQKGLRFHLGEQKYREFETRFLEKTTRFPRKRKANKTKRTGASRSK
jgi:hypothetical protein